MSDLQPRRVDDTRIIKMETTIDKMQDDIVYIKTKIDNGFSTSIKSTENKVNYIDKRNREEHKLLMDSVVKLSGKFDRMLWFLVTSSIGISAGVILAIVKDWI